MGMAWVTIIHRAGTRCLTLAGLLGMGLLSLTTGGAAVSAPSPAPGTGILIAFKEQTPVQARAAAVQKLGLVVDTRVRSPYFVRAMIPSRLTAAGLTVKTAIASLREEPAIRLAEQDRSLELATMPNDPLFPELWGLHNTGQTDGIPDADIDAPEAWSITTGNPDVIVAVIDTGVDYTHPDLAPNILRDGEGNIVGYDFVDDDADPFDPGAHGTHVAGTIAAAGNNGIGIIGVAPQARIMPIRSFRRSGGGEASHSILAIDFAREHGAHIINASWVTYDYNTLMFEAVERARDAGILVVAAAGNYSRGNDATPIYPANFNSELDNVVSVAATSASDHLAEFSNYGRRTVDIAAPGEEILSTIPNRAYAAASGTSGAAPHVSGVAALIKSRFPSISPADLRRRLLGGADRIIQLEDYVRAGRLNAFNGLEDDDIPPAAPADARVTARSATSLRWSWTATGDDGTSGGAASYYDVRYSPRPITAKNFDDADFVTQLDLPAMPGQAETIDLTGLYPGQAYYLALRVGDNAGNVSELVTIGPYATRRGTVLLHDDVEGKPRFEGWPISTEDPENGTHIYSDSPGSNFAPYTNLALTQIGSLRVPGNMAFLSFRARTALYTHMDFLHVEVSEDGGSTWRQQLPSLTGFSEWRTHTIPLPLLRGNHLKVRFRLDTTSWSSEDGVLLDDICIYTAPQQVLLSDNGENAPQFNGADTWARSTETSYSLVRSYSDSPYRPYPPNQDSSLTSDRSVSLRGISPWLVFAAKTDLERYWDYLHVEVSPDGGKSWVRQRQSLTGRADWTTYSVPLHQFRDNDRVLVRFRLISDDSYEHDGVWIDDIRIIGEPLQAVSQPAPGGKLAVSGQLRFGTLRNGKTRNRALTLRNRSRTESLVVHFGEPTGDFGVVGLSRSMVIAPGKQQRVTVRFRPRRAGEHHEALEIASSDPEQPAASIALYGKAR